MYRSYIFSIIILLLIFGCRKEELPSKPEIFIDTPIHNSSFIAMDTLIVRGIISGQNPIKRISVVLQDMDNINVLPEKHHYPDLNVVEFELSYNLSDIFLKSGSYYIRVQALDENYTVNHYTKINIGELEQSLEAYAFVLGNQRNFELETTDLYFEALKKYTFEGHYKQGVYNSIASQFAYTTSGLEKLVLYDLDDEQQVWQLIAEGADQTFNDLKLFDNYYYFIQNHGSFSKIDFNGVTKLRHNYNFDTVPFKLSISDQWISLLSVPGSNPMYYFLDFLNSNTATQYYGTATQIKGEFLFSLEGKTIIVGPHIYTDSEDRFIDIYDPLIPEGNFDSRLLTNVPLVFIHNLGDGKLLCATSDRVFDYNILNNSTNDFLINMNIDKAYYEELNNQFFVISDGFIRSYLYPNGQLLSEIEMNDEVLDLFFIYNK